MTTFKLNPMLVENLAITKNHLNGFEIKCLSKSTDVSQLLEKQLKDLVASIIEKENCFNNLLTQTTVLGHNHVEFLIGARELYDSTDEEAALSWLPVIIEELTNARAFVNS